MARVFCDHNGHPFYRHGTDDPRNYQCYPAGTDFWARSYDGRIDFGGNCDTPITRAKDRKRGERNGWLDTDGDGMWNLEVVDQTGMLLNNVCYPHGKSARID